MASRTPRRVFAPSFVVTLAALPAISACVVEQQAPHPNPPAPGTYVPTPDNPPPPTPPAPEPTGTVALPPKGPIVNPPPPKGSGDPATPTPPAKPREWILAKLGSDCEIRVPVDCPVGVKCNPPPPQKIACPANVDLSKPRKVTEIGANECVVERDMPTCPPNARCNPPPPPRIPCPP